MADEFGEGTAFYQEHQKSWDIFTKWGLRLGILSVFIVAFAFWAIS